MSRENNLKLANELMETVKSCGRKFFEEKHGHKAKFSIKDSGHIYFTDDYTGKDICVRGEWIHSRSFSHGGGLNGFVRHIAEFIRTGKSILSAEYMGQHWGYGDDISIVRAKAVELGIAS